MRCAFFLVLSTITLAAVLTAPGQAATVPTPTRLLATAQTYDSLTLGWNAVAGATNYRVQLSTTSSMGTPRYFSFATNNGVVTGLKPATKYYFRVAVADAANHALSAYTSQTYPSRTTAVLPKLATPRNLHWTGKTSDSLTLAWDAVNTAPKYRVVYSTSSTMSSARRLAFPTNSGVLTGLKAKTKYYFRVAVVDATNTYLFSPLTATTYPSATTAPVPVIPPTPGPADLNVGSFNISGANNDGKASGDQRIWSERKPVVVSQIVGENSDVVGLQEAYQSTGYSTGIGQDQFTDLRNGLNAAGKPFEVTDRYRYNCERSTSPSSCDPVDRGASNGTRIIYNTATLDLLTSGSFKYANQVSGQTDRYLAWATFTQKATGKRFFFVDTHLSPNDAATKKREWQELIPKVKALNTASLPIIAVGDFNTSKFGAEAQEMLPAMKTAGFGDVMNQEYQVNPARNVRAELVVNGWINSFNGFRRSIVAYSYTTRHDKVGNGVDWIFATNLLRVKKWKVVIDFNSSTLNINGVIPSDHNMLSSTVLLP